MANKLLRGGYGWGHAKNDLIQKLINHFELEREKFNYFINNPNEIENILEIGAKRAKKVAKITLARVRENLGYN